MKKLTAILLTIIMIVTLVTMSDLSIRAVEKEYQYKSAFDSYAKEKGFKDYSYEEIDSGDHWTLVYAKWEGDACDKLIKGTFSDRVIITYDDGQPFTFGYGVFWRRVGFVPLTEIWDNPYFDGLHEMFVKHTDAVMSGGNSAVWLIGDTDRDGKLTIIDATHIQKRLAGLEEYPFYDALPGVAQTKFGADIRFVSDIDRDSVRSILDATTIQKRLANDVYDQQLDFKPLANVTSYISSDLAEDARLIRSFEQLCEYEKTLSLFGEDFAQGIFSQCNDAFFEDSVLLMYTDVENSAGYRRENFKVSKDKFFDINFEQDMVYPSGGSPDVMTNRLILLSMKREDVPACAGVHSIVNPKSPSDVSYLYVPLSESFHTNAVAVDGPSVSWKESYNGNESEMITDFDDTKQYGMMALLSTRSQYEAFMNEYGCYRYTDLHPEDPADYGKELEDIYDEEFFEKYSLVVAVYRYVYGSYTTKVIATATQGDTLYVALRTTNVPEEPHAAPIYSHNISINMVKKTETENIRSLSLLLMREE